jgi:hypothetical protein
MRVFRLATIVLLLLTIVPSFDGQSTPAAQHSPSSQQSALIEDLVYANRILYDQGVIDGFGHVSVRDEKNPQHFLMSRSMAARPLMPPAAAFTSNASFTPRSIALAQTLRPSCTAIRLL